MNTILSILCCVLLASCITPAVTPSSPAPQGNYLITEYEPWGNVKRTWQARSYTETDFPKSVRFHSVNGESVILTGSYQIDSFIP